MPNKLSEEKIEEIVQKTPPGVWIWRLENIRKNYIEELKKANCRRVYLKVFDDLKEAKLFDQHKLVPEFLNAGISVVGWGYHFDRRTTINVGEEAKLIAEAMAVGLDGYVVDVEKEVKDPATYPLVRDLLVHLRGSVADKFLGYTSFGHPGFHKEIPWRILDEYTDLAFPQIYFEKWRGSSWGSDDGDRIRRALLAHADLSLTNPILPVWGSEEDTRRPASRDELRIWIRKFPGSSVFRIPGVDGGREEQGEAWNIDYSPVVDEIDETDSERLDIEHGDRFLDPILPIRVTRDDGSTADASFGELSLDMLSREQKTMVGMRISGGFEGEDPWANITGNFDDEGLTCGMLGKTFGDGDQQKIIRRYLDRYGQSELLNLMPQSGREYLALCALPAAQGTARIINWTVNRTSERVRQPYLGELEQFWKSPKMVSMQFETALADETPFAEQHAAAWGITQSVHGFCFFFDIATQNGSLKGLGPMDVDALFAKFRSPVEACLSICRECEGADAIYSNAYDAQRNGARWKTLVEGADEVSLRLFALGWLRSLLTRKQYRFTTMNRRGTLALGTGFINKRSWDLRGDLGLLPGVRSFLSAIPSVGASGTPGVGIGTSQPAEGGTENGRTLRVSVGSLNLRSTPDKADSNNILAVLSKGSLVQVVDSSRPDKWWKVRTDLRGNSAEGFVSSQYLTALSVSDGATSNAITAVHLRPTAQLDAAATASPLADVAAPRRTGITPEERCRELGQIIAYLSVSKSERYRATAASTFCNIYAYDYCYLAGAFLPRVWWERAAIAKLAQHQPVIPILGQTVDEMRANDLCVWFDQFGTQFGWRSTVDVGELQQAANEGGIGIIVARNVVEARSGHIVIVPPEVAEFRAKRLSSGAVDVPLQSQAGRVNFQYGMGSHGKRWWTDQSRFRQFGLWIHA